tara:strand:+ start:2509 stop:4269 length:1761 start_codon:yes stop_codon:yes gene_type:complete
MKTVLSGKYKRTLLIIFFIYLVLLSFLISLSFGLSEALIDYKEFGIEDRCQYSLNQINFYDIQEANKKIIVYKDYLTSIFKLDQITCVNKVTEIQDGWPEIRIKVGYDNSLFQLLKFFGFSIILLLFISNEKLHKQFSLIALILFSLFINFMFSSDFRNPEFPGFYTYEFLILEVLVIYFVYLKIKNPVYLKTLTEKIIGIFFPNLNKYIYLIVPAFVGLLNLNKFNKKSFPVIQEYLISYEFGFVRRGFLGTLFNLISDDIFSIAYLYIPIVIFLIHFIYTYLILKIYDYSTKSPIDIILIFSPALIGHQIYTISGGPANKEIFGLISVLLIAYYSLINNKRLYILGAVLLNLSIYIHEVNLFLIFLMLYMLRNKKYFIFVAFSTFTNLIMFLYNYFNTENINYIADKLCSEYYINFQNMGCDKSYYLRQDFFSSLEMVYSTVFADNKYFLVYGAYLLLALAPLLINGFIVKNKLLTFIVLLNIFPLFVTAIDWGRWLFVLLNMLTILYFHSSSYENTNIKTTDFVNLIVFGLSYLILWRVPYCCVDDLNIIYLLRVNKLNISYFIPIAFFVFSSYKEIKNKKLI